MRNLYIVGGNEIHGFVVSKLARPDDKQVNCARTWIMTKFNQVKTWPTREKAQKVADSYNRFE